MPYSIRTKDGIVIDNIPDNVDKNSPELKAKVEAKRAERKTASVAQPSAPSPVVPQQPEESGIMRGFGLVTRAIAPYAAAGGAGALAGLPAGGVGAIPGAIAGMTAYGLGQLADVLTTGGRGQEAVERGLTAIGLPEPQTGGERVGVAGIRGVLGAGSTASQALQTAERMKLARLLQSQTQPANVLPASVTENVLRAAGTGPGRQAIAGGTGAATSQTAREVGLPEPVAIAAGVVGGSAPYMSVGGAQRAAQNVTQTVRNAPQAIRQTVQQQVAQARGTQPPPPPTVPTGQMPPNQVRQNNVALLERENIPVSPGQRSGAPLTQTMESTMAYLPGSTGQVAKFQDLQQRAFTKALLRRAGIESDIATEDVLRAGQQRFAQIYDNLEQNTRLMGGSQPLANRLARIEADYGSGFSGQMRRTYRTMRDDLQNWAAGNPRQGQTFQRMQEELSAEISRAARSDAPGSERYRQALLGMRGALFELMERNTPPQIARQWREANRQYAIFKTIEESMLDPSQKTINTGFINPRVVAREQRTHMPDDWTRGDPSIDSFTRLVKAGAGIIPDPIPNSGTAQRMFAQDILTGGGQMFGLTGGGDALQRMGQFARGGVGTAASVTAVDPVTGLVVPNLVSRTWYRQPQQVQQRGTVALPAAVEATKQRQKPRRERMADALQRSQ